MSAFEEAAAKAEDGDTEGLIRDLSDVASSRPAREQRLMGAVVGLLKRIEKKPSAKKSVDPSKSPA